MVTRKNYVWFYASNNNLSLLSICLRVVAIILKKNTETFVWIGFSYGIFEFWYLKRDNNITMFIGALQLHHQIEEWEIIMSLKSITRLQCLIVRYEFAMERNRFIQFWIDFDISWLLLLSLTMRLDIDF